MTHEINIKVLEGVPYYVFAQCFMFFVYYGISNKMPWFVVWFPSLVVGAGVAGTLLIVIIFGIVFLGFLAGAFIIDFFREMKRKRY